MADAFFFLLLLLGQLELVVACAPEFGEFLVFLLGRNLLLYLPLDLKLSAALDGQFHLHFASFLLFEEAVCLVLGFCHLLVQDTLFLVSNGAELFNLMVDHALTFLLFFREPLLFFFLLHEVSGGFLLGKLLDLLFLRQLLLPGHSLDLDLLLVGSDQVGLHLLGALLTSKFTLFLALKVLFNLALDEFTFQHFFFQTLDVIQFKFFELV